MRDISTNILAGVFVALTALACSKNRDNERKPAPRVTDPSSNLLTVDAAEVLKHKDAEACDKKYAEQIMEIAGALDQRKAQIEELEKTTPLSEDYETVKLGPTFLFKLKKDLVAKPGWRREEHSWAKAIELFAKVKEKAVDKDWLYLNRRVRSLVMDDKRRVVHKRNMSLDYNDDDTLADLRAGIDNCLKDPNCNLPRADEKIKALIAKTPLYSKHYTAMIQKAVHDEEALKKFLHDVDVDIVDRGFELNPLVKWTSASELELPLDPGVFSSAKSEIASFIEAVWKNEKVRLKIRWADKASSKDIFQIQFVDAVGARASMNYDKKSVTLVPGTRTRTIPHEVGHVLGFRDEYFTLWNAEQCLYVVSFTEEDLMSTSASGKVTETAWKRLETAYKRPEEFKK